LGEIYEALERARRREKESGRREAPTGGDMSESLRRAAVEEAVQSATAHLDDTLPEAPAHPPVEPVELAPADPAILVPGDEKMELGRQMATRVADELERRGVRSVAVVSGVRGEGKSTVSCNLAIGLASLSAGRRVALVELDLRRPSLAEKLGLRPRAGIEAVLEGGATLPDACIPLKDPALDVYLVQEPRRAAHELLVGDALSRLVEELSSRYATVVVDTPPVLLVPDASLVLKHVESFLPVARMGMTRARALDSLLDSLPGRVPLGGVLNCSRTPWHARRYNEYYYEATEAGSGKDRP